jgi:multidrug resistance efflux pump
MPTDPSEQLSVVQQGVISADVSEFMHRPPHWLMRAGLSMLAGALTLFFILAAVIRYPDTITSRMTITGSQPVVEVIARQGGHIANLRVKEGAHVKKDDILAVIQNPARLESILALAPKLERFASELQKESPTPETQFGPEDGLGKLQDSYSEFLNIYGQFKATLADRYADEAGALLREQMNSKREQIKVLQKQLEASQREAILAREKYARLKTLHARDSISTEALQAGEMALLQGNRSEMTSQRAFGEAEIEASKTEKELRDLEHTRENLLRTARENLRTSLNKFRAEVDLWQADYVLRAPVEGTLAFYDFWSEQQFVTAGRQVFLVIPKTTQLVGRMLVNGGGAGKIVPGQIVRIRFDDFPYKQFGVGTGKVQSVSMIARDGVYLVLVALPYPLSTSFEKNIQFRQEMSGEASVITKDISLLGRILSEIRRAFSKTK